jgi:selenide,water dikinase
VRAGLVPLLPQTRELARAGHIAGGTRRNFDDAQAITSWDSAVDEIDRMILCDAQTSGGLLISVPSDNADALVQALQSAGTLAANIIGDVREGEPRIHVIP